MTVELKEKSELYDKVRGLLTTWNAKLLQPCCFMRRVRPLGNYREDLIYWQSASP